MDISIVIPAYNERRRLPDNLSATFDYLEETFVTFEVIIVDDGSEDALGDYIDRLPKKYRRHVRYLAYHPNRGKGHAVRHGVLEAAGELIAYIDADGATPVAEMNRLLAAVRGGADVAAGSRAIGSPDTKVDKTIHRYLMGLTFTAIVRAFTGVSLSDTQCGFKLFTRKAARDLFGALRTEGFAFDVELLARAAARGYAVTEVAVNWHDVAGSKVNIIFDSLRMLGEVVRISRMLKRGG